MVPRDLWDVMCLVSRVVSRIWCLAFCGEEKGGEAKARRKKNMCFPGEKRGGIDYITPAILEPRLALSVRFRQAEVPKLIRLE